MFQARSCLQLMTLCRDLEVLNISCNNITQLPVPLFTLSKLQELNVCQNKIAQLCDSLAAMEGLQVMLYCVQH
jgi:Leucine-rich repeat (LRR) protein